MSSTLLAIFLAAGTTGVVMHLLGSFGPRFYHNTNHWDTTAHFVSGLSVAAIVHYALNYVLAGFLLILWTVALVILIALAWEVYERIEWDEGVDRPRLYAEDVALDVAMAVIATLVLLLYRVSTGAVLS